MALEISEISIRMQVQGDTAQAVQAGPPAGPDEEERLPREEIVEDCVRRVLRILKAAEQR